MNLTPPPVLVETPPPQPPAAGKSLPTLISLALGIVVSTGLIVGVLGKAFYVERPEFTAKVVADVSEKSEVRKTLELLGQAMERQEAAMTKQSADIQAVRDLVQSLRLEDARRGRR